ncbi:DNA primase [Gorillibacterium sp. sgz500922]|uniref:DNA primase n=1 Tax=Gorillibacterium sp. sgz500922 TaxID=3446694 RepID=UPI003F668AEB
MSYGRIPDEVIESVLKRHDIADVVGKYVHLKKQGKYLKGLCPFHSEKTPSFSVNPERQIYYCFGCRATGNLIRFVMEMEGYTYPEAVRQLAEEAGLPTDWGGEPRESAPERKERENLFAAHELASRLYQYILVSTKQGQKALNYVRNRGVSQKLIETFGIGCAADSWDLLAQQLDKRGFSLPLCEKGGLVSAKSDGNGYLDKFRDRLIFPIHDFKGKVIAFAGRALGDIQPKYLNSPESPLFSKSHNLYNFHRARPQIRKTGQIVLFEGYLDVIKAWEAGVENGVATMGTALTEEHCAILRRNADEVLICYDGDSAGQNAAYKALAMLEKTGLLVRVAMLPEAKDPDEFIAAYGPGRFRKEIIEGAVSSVRYRLQYVRRNFNLSSEDGRLRYLETAAKLVAELASPLEREHYAMELTSEFGAGPDGFKQEVAFARQEFLKKRENRDNKEISWNNGRNNGNGAGRHPSPGRASHNAEVLLLGVMMHDRDVAEYVRDQIGDEFISDTHAALAAYLYAYYAQGNPPNASRYLATLQDERLETAAGAILMKTLPETNQQVIDDYISQIRKEFRGQAIRQKKEEMASASKAGDVMLAAKIASEIITLEKQLKSFGHDNA